MSGKNELHARDRDFFRLLSKFAFSNPFDKKSLQLAYNLADGQYPIGNLLTKKIIERVGQRLEKVTLNGKVNWHRFSNLYLSDLAYAITGNFQVGVLMGGAEMTLPHYLKGIQIRDMPRGNLNHIVGWLGLTFFL